MEPIESPVPVFFCLSGLVFVLSLLFLSASLRIVPEEKRLAHYRLGRYLGEKGPGLVLLIPFIDRGVIKDVAIDAQLLSTQQVKLALVGKRGKALSRVFKPGGQVLLETGETLEAVSETPIVEGQAVQVRRVIVEVEPAE